MVIQDIERFVASLPDWSMLDGCFSGRIRPTDVDGLVERGGYCLFLEHKGHGAPLKTAQRRTFEALARQGNLIVVFWTDDPDKRNVTRIEYLKPHTDWIVLPHPSLEMLRALCEWWFKKVDSREWLSQPRRDAR